MIKKLVEIEMLQKDDYILTPDGTAVVVEDEQFNSQFDRYYAEVKIKWIDCCKYHKNGTIELFARECCTLIENPTV